MLRAEICISELEVECILGVGETERVKKQKVLITLSFVTDIKKAAETDKIEDAVDYEELSDEILSFVSASEFHLVEALALNILEVCFKNRRILSAKVKIEKPNILPFSKGVALELVRSNENR